MTCFIFKVYLYIVLLSLTSVKTARTNRRFMCGMRPEELCGHKSNAKWFQYLYDI
jgi:hypothetical protein